MIAYLDACALVKLFLSEHFSRETAAFVSIAKTVGTSLITRAEIAAALAKAVRLRVLSAATGRAAQRAFDNEWQHIAKIQVTESLVTRAQSLAWEYDLRGYDAVQLASALTWQEALGMPVTLATFDRQLWEAGRRAGMRVWPEKL